MIGCSITVQVKMPWKHDIGTRRISHANPSTDTMMDKYFVKPAHAFATACYVQLGLKAQIEALLPLGFFRLFRIRKKMPLFRSWRSTLCTEEVISIGMQTFYLYVIFIVFFTPWHKHHLRIPFPFLHFLPSIRIPLQAFQNDVSELQNSQW